MSKLSFWKLEGFPPSTSKGKQTRKEKRSLTLHPSMNTIVASAVIAVGIAKPSVHLPLVCTHTSTVAASRAPMLMKK